MKLLFRVAIVALIGFALGMLVACSTDNAPPAQPSPSSPAPAATPSAAPLDAEVQACVESAAGAAWMKGDQAGSPEDLYDDPQIISDCERLAAGVDGAQPADLGADAPDPSCLEEKARDMVDLFPSDMSQEEIMEDPLVAGACQ